MDRENKSRYQTIIAEGSVKALAFYVSKTYLIPIMIPFITVFLGKMDNLPLSYIWIGVLASLAFVFTWLLRMNEWLYKTRVQDKIAFSHLVVSKDIKGGGVVVQLNLKSEAEFPIDFKVTTFKLRLGDRVPLHNDYSFSSSIPPHGVAWKNSFPVKIDSTPLSRIIEGELEYEIKYGRFKNYKASLIGKKGLIISFDETGNPVHIVWSDVA